MNILQKILLPFIQTSRDASIFLDINDISDWQYPVDFDQLSKDISHPERAGFWIKITEGTGYLCRWFLLFWSKLLALGFNLGGYHFLLFAYNGIEQARWFAKNLPAGWKIAPLLDVEDVKGLAAVGAETAANVVLDFCLECYRLLGVWPVIYSAKWIWDSLPDRIWMRFFHLVVAHYIPLARGEDPLIKIKSITPLKQNYIWTKFPALPRVFLEWVGWQFTSQAHYPGFGENLDVIRFYGNGNPADLLANLSRDNPLFPMSGRVTSWIGIRKRDAPNGKIIGGLSFHSPVKIVEFSNDWCHLDTGEWCSSRYIEPI